MLSKQVIEVTKCTLPLLLLLVQFLAPRLVNALLSGGAAANDLIVNPSALYLVGAAAVSCTSACYRVDERRTSSKCRSDCDCDGKRSCSKNGFCEGGARGPGLCGEKGGEEEGAEGGWRRGGEGGKVAEEGGRRGGEGSARGPGLWGEEGGGKGGKRGLRRAGGGRKGG